MAGVAECYHHSVALGGEGNFLPHVQQFAVCWKWHSQVAAPVLMWNVQEAVGPLAQRVA